MRDLLLNDEFWEKAYTRLSVKTNLSAEDKRNLYEVYAFKREEVVNSLLDGSYAWATPSKVKIAKRGTKKKRVVYIYPIKDRIVQGVLYRFLNRYYSKCFESNCYSYKEGVSTSSAIRYIRDCTQGNNYHAVKVDIHAYFNSVSKDRLVEMIDELNLPSGLDASLRKLMLSERVLDKGVELSEYRGLCPGSPVASFFANYCLRECDKWFKDNGIIYARYSDDIIILDEKLEIVELGLETLQSYLAKYSLTINEDKFTWFDPSMNVEFLGLKLRSDNKIDISDHAKKKIKKQIHRWCRKGRVRIEKDYVPFEIVAEDIFRRLNNKNFKCYIRNEGTFGWCHYAFRYITTTDSLREIDYYLKDTMRAMYTGKHNKANARHLQNGELEALGYVSLVDLFNLYYDDFDYYCEVIELI